MLMHATRSDNRRQRSAEQMALGIRVAADAVIAFGDRAEEADLHRLAHLAVDELCNGPVKVTAFVPILALRRVGELLNEIDRNKQTSEPNERNLVR